jgi:hypothetical protein
MAADRFEIQFEGREPEKLLQASNKAATVGEIERCSCSPTVRVIVAALEFQLILGEGQQIIGLVTFPILIGKA